MYKNTQGHHTKISNKISNTPTPLLRIFWSEIFVTVKDNANYHIDRNISFNGVQVYLCPTRPLGSFLLEWVFPSLFRREAAYYNLILKDKGHELKEPVVTDYYARYIFNRFVISYWARLNWKIQNNQ